MSRDINLKAIRPNPDQPRKYFNPNALNDLADSMKANGLAAPILVRPYEDGFQIVHGERRYRAAQSLKWDTIPAEVREVADDEMQRIALVENVQRQDLSPIEEARAFQQLLDGGMTQEKLGKVIGKTQSYIAQKLRLIKMPDSVVTLVDRGQITEGHARLLMTLKAFYGDMIKNGVAPKDNPDIKFDPNKKGGVPDPEDEDAFFSFILDSTCIFIDLTRPWRFSVAPVPYIKDADQTWSFFEACADHYKWMMRHYETGVPAYGDHMLYFGLFSARFKLSVAELKEQLDRHKRHLFSMMLLEKMLLDIEPKIKKGHEVEWLKIGARMDLERSGIFTYVEKHKLPAGLKEGFREFEKSSKRFSWPTLFSGIDDKYFHEDDVKFRQAARKAAKGSPYSPKKYHSEAEAVT